MTSPTLTTPQLVSLFEPHRGLISPPPTHVRLWESDGCGVYIDSDWGPGVPYGPVDHPDGRRNHGYVRIKDDASVLDRIPETVGYPELAELLAEINATDSPIESVGCERGVFPGDRGLPIKIGSYVDMLFTDLVLNDAVENALQLAVHLLQAVGSCERWWTSVEAVLQRFRFVPQTEAPWGLMVRVNAHGRDEAEARKLWAEALKRLGDAIRVLPKDFRWVESLADLSGCSL